MKIFDGRKAAKEYMSTHTLAFSTPDLTLTRFAIWLGDIVPDPNNKENALPRLYTFVEEKDLEPVQVIDDDVFVPTGAVRTASMYDESKQTSSDGKFCAECGNKVSMTAKFCPECGVVCD
jgi:hypothetical protein